MRTPTAPLLQNPRKPRGYLGASALSAIAALLMLQASEVPAQTSPLGPPNATGQASACAPVTVQNVRPQQGRVMLAVYDSEESFQRKPVAALMVAAEADEAVRFSVCGQNGRALAFMVFQDLNGNGRFDMNVLGLPAEPWGASGSLPAFSAPTWASAQVPLQQQGLTIALSQ